MPEGPEVKVITDGIRSHLLDKTIVNAQILSGRYLKTLPDGWNEFKMPVTVSDVSCKGKFIYFTLNDGTYIFNTLGMTGSWSAKPTSHSRVRFDLDDGREIYFNDIRNFGTLKLSVKNKELDKKISELGPDMLSEDISDLDLYKRLKKSNKTLAESLMDQKVICGVGNYLKSECLYFSRLSPNRMTHDLTQEEVSTLNAVIKSVIRKSYETGGATIYTFSGFEGQVGDYSRRFAIYNQSKDPQGREVTRETTRDGRTTFWIPDIQK